MQHLFNKIDTMPIEYFLAVILFLALLVILATGRGR